MELASEKNSENTKVIVFILILVIGSVLFWVVTTELFILTPNPASDWRDVTPAISDKRSMNITTSTFNVVGEKWQVIWWPSGSDPQDWCGVEIYNASTDMRLQEFTLSTTWPEISTGSGDIETTGSFYLKIQAYKTGADVRYSWTVAVREYMPQPRFDVWLALIVLICIAVVLAYIGYEVYKVFR